LFDEAFIRERCDWDEFEDYAELRLGRAAFARMTEMQTGVPAEELRAARGSMPPAAMARSITASA
jgi:formate dehydrogenase major subunit